MRTPTTHELLDLWEQGRGASPTARVGLLLDVACPEQTAPALPVGRRDALLIELYERLFGARADALAWCPACHEAVEAEVPLAAVRSSAPQTSDSDRLTLERDGYRVEARLPTGDDLDVAGATGDVEAARRQLLARCIVWAARAGQTVDWSDLPAHVVAAVGERMNEVDPLADISLRLTCPACGEVWNASFDVRRFLWDALDIWTSRLLGEIHDLASAYGWSQAEILGLSPWRRQRYLERVRA